MGFKWIINYWEGSKLKAISVFAGSITEAIEQAVSTGDLTSQQIVSVFKI